jgi:DNA-binding transcriptional ArsR family regulator
MRFVFWKWVNLCANEFEEERRRAEVFDALSHPTRILILKALNESPAGFADLKKQLGIDSSGHLQHHISKLNSLVKTDENGKYALSDEGKDALNSVETVEKVTESGPKHKPKTVTTKTSNILKLASLALVALLVASCSVTIYQHNLMSVLQNELNQRNAKISDLCSQVDSLDATVSQQTETVSYLNTELNLAKSIIDIERPAESRYLTTGEQPEGNMTKILLESTDVWFQSNYTVSSFSDFANIHVNFGGALGTYGFGTYNVGVGGNNVTLMVARPNTFNGYMWISYIGDEPILMIGATVRNDYTFEDAENLTDQNVPVSNLTSMDNSWSFVKLTAKVYDAHGNVIETTEPTVFIGPAPIGTQEFVVNSGGTTQVVFYLEPESWDIDHYEIFVEYVAASSQSTTD